jgi:glycolate oxidase iron-sulfur subunit
MKLGQAVRPLLPEVLKAKVPPKRSRRLADARTCAQGAAAGGLRAACDDAQHQLRHGPRAGCRGHPDRDRRQGRLLRRGEVPPERPGQARDQMRANIDAWWPAVEAGEVEAIVMNASGCGATGQGLRHALRDDSAYAAKARASARWRAT